MLFTFLSNLFKKKEVEYKPKTRLEKFICYERLEFEPHISKVLDGFAYDTSANFNVYSGDEKVQEALNDLFYKRLNITANLIFWFRNAAKYGDNFIYLLSEKNKGILYAKQLIVFDMIRIEKNNPVIPTDVTFKNRNDDTIFEYMEIGHFRYIRSCNNLPYGDSILDTYEKYFDKPKKIKLRYDKKLIHQFRHAMTLELNKIAIIHLYHLGFEKEALENFKITFDEN